MMQPSLDSTLAFPEAPDTRGLPAAWPNREQSIFACAAGIRWHVQEMGSGTPLLLLHGTGSASLSWRDVMPALARNYRVLSVDLPGHGLTSHVEPQRMSLAAMSEALGELLAAVDAKPKIIVGHSAGMAIALRLALDGHVQPSRLIGLNAALLPYRGPLAQAFGGLARLFASLPFLPAVVARRAADEEAIRRLLEGTGSTLDRAGVALYQRLFADEEHVRSTLAMMANWNLGSLLDDIGPLSPRIHLIVAEGDRAVAPSQTAVLRERHSEIGVTRMPALGHLAHEERPKKTARLIRAIANSIG